ncbi:MAG: OmpA family protein [Nitrospira sp.]|nr:OmpA family protein [Nitrospira sp.]MDH4327339.1 OmpA family protein [Nitrospira sp.]MDH5252125.1 OmpA family protein [Nitrospira sp.]MDH5625045.1 OmpA family protein [Nitrospira sp.]
MRQDRGLGIVVAPVMALLLMQGCSALSGSGTGEEGKAGEERIREQAIKEAPARNLDRSDLSTSTQDAMESSKESLMAVFFDFDQDSLRADALPILEANAKQMKNGGVARMLLEGRGDEIGTSAYNLVLGERRAKNVKTYLQNLGLSTELKTTSYGKDRPLCVERTAECMQKNRSVHFTVKE